MAELKRKLAELGLETKGTKTELLARVEKYLHEQGMAHVGYPTPERGCGLGLVSMKAKVKV